MTDPTDAPDMIDHGVSDVLAEHELVHVPLAVVALVEEAEHAGDTFITDVPHWDEPDDES